MILALAACGNESAPTEAILPTSDPNSTTAPVTQATTETTEPEIIQATEAILYDLPMCSIVLTEQSEESTDDQGNTIFTYTYQNVWLYLPNDSISETVTLDLLNRIDSTRSAAEQVQSNSGGLYRVSYTPRRIDSGILSLSGVQTSHSGGTANSACVAVTYDLLTGKVLTLKDVLVKNCTADILCRLVVDALAEYAGEYGLYEDYSVTVEDRFSGNFLEDDAWYLSIQGLCFDFAPYELAPRSAGIVTAVVPYDQLFGVLEDAYFPVEQVYTEGTIQVSAFNKDLLTQAEVILDPNGSAMLLQTDSLVYDIMIETGEWDDHSGFVSESTVFAADSLVEGSAILVQIPGGSTINITYTSGDSRVSLPLTAANIID